MEEKKGKNIGFNIIKNDPMDGHKVLEKVFSHLIMSHRSSLTWMRARQL